MIKEFMQKLSLKEMNESAKNLIMSCEKTVELCRVNGHALEAVKTKNPILLKKEYAEH